MSLLLALLLAAPAEDLAAALERYERRLGEAIAAVEAPGPLREHARELLELASAITPAFIAAHPDCGPYLEAALTVKERWPLLGPESIERDFHRDGALPPGAPALCYHMKDLIVHPATVLVLLAHGEGDRAVLRRELDEIGAHIGAVRALLSSQPSP